MANKHRDLSIHFSIYHYILAHNVDHLLEYLAGYHYVLDHFLEYRSEHYNNLEYLTINHHFLEY